MTHYDSLRLNTLWQHQHHSATPKSLGDVMRRANSVLLSCLVSSLLAPLAQAHHSFAMYDRSKMFVFTGVVVNVNPDPSHLQILFVPLNDARDALVRDAKGERVVWNVEMESAAASAREGITASTFTRGTVFSVGLTPLRNGETGGARQGGLFRCPADKPPAPGKHCDSVEGATSHQEGELATPTANWTLPAP